MRRIKMWLAAAILAATGMAGCDQLKEIDTAGNLVPRTVDQDPSLPAVALNGSVFHAETFGNPDHAMLVVLHGGPGADYRYLLRCREFASQGYFVVFYDQRGSGLSKRHHQDVYSIQLMLDDLDAVIAFYRRSADQKIFLLGHSWGGMLATAYIDANPAKIDGVILAEPGGFVWQDVVGYVGRAQAFGPTSESLNDVLYTDQFLTGTMDAQEILDYKYGLSAATDGAADNPIGNEGPLPFWRLGAVVNTALFDLGEKEKPDWTTNLHRFSTQVLFVYSERNKAYGPDHARRVSSAYPNVRLERIAGAGHDLLSFPTGWQNFYPIALEYLNSLK